MQSEKSGSPASDNQLKLASELGIDCDATVGTATLVRSIERELGQDTLLELTRWFVMSVLRHLERAAWKEPAASTVQEDHQYSLAATYLAVDEFKKSLRTVLKDSRCKFTLTDFAKTRNLDRRILSYKTKAFERAKRLLLQAGWAGQISQATEIETASKAESSVADKSVVNRRAMRRGYLESEPRGSASSEDVKHKRQDRIKANGMSEAEYRKLEQALMRKQPQPIQHNWNYRSNEERMSLIMGLLSGFGVVALVLWLISLNY